MSSRFLIVHSHTVVIDHLQQDANTFGGFPRNTLGPRVLVELFPPVHNPPFRVLRTAGWKFGGWNPFPSTYHQRVAAISARLPTAPQLE
jgi:hypothetical protein